MEYKYTQETVDWLKQQMDIEKKRRVYYQHIVYSVCNMLDQIDGRHPGNCIVCGTAEEQYNDVEAKIQQLTTELDSLRHQLAAAQERERWVPVTERLPKKDGNYMTGASYWTEAHELMFSAKSNRWWNFSNSEYAEPTHWRELPQLPEADHAESV